MENKPGYRPHIWNFFISRIASKFSHLVWKGSCSLVVYPSTSLPHSHLLTFWSFYTLHWRLAPAWLSPALDFLTRNLSLHSMSGKHQTFFLFWHWLITVSLHFSVDWTDRSALLSIYCQAPVVSAELPWYLPQLIDCLSSYSFIWWMLAHAGFTLCLCWLLGLSPSNSLDKESFSYQTKLVMISKLKSTKF